MNAPSITARVSTLALAGCLTLAWAWGQADAAQKAYELRMGGDADAAEQLLEKALAQDPEDARAWFELARVGFHQGGKNQDLDGAQAAIEKATALDERNVRYLCLAGRIATLNFILKHHAGQTDQYRPQMDKAIAALERAVALDPDCHEARGLLVSCYGNNPPDLGGDRKRALAHVEALEARSPIDGARARCELERKSAKERIASWTALAGEHDDDARLHENLALELARAGHVAPANQHVARALELDPARPQVILEVGLALAFEKRLEAATEFLVRYEHFDPPPPRSLQAYARMLIGRIQKMSGDEEGAQDSLARARELDPYCWPTMRPPAEQIFTAP